MAGKEKLFVQQTVGLLGKENTLVMNKLVYSQFLLIAMGKDGLLDILV